MEWVLETVTCWGPADEADDTHHQYLVEIIPRLDDHLIETAVWPESEKTLAILWITHQKLVVKARDSAEDGAGNDHPDPDAAFERDSFLLATATDHREGQDGDEYTCPLPRVELLAEDKDGTEQDKDRTSGIDRGCDGQRKVLQSVVSADPRSQHDSRLDYNIYMYAGVFDRRDIQQTARIDTAGGREDNQGQEDERAEYGIEQQNWDDSVVF